MMEITCDSCGKRYRVDENKIKGEKARLKCKACENIILVTKPKPQPPPRQNKIDEKPAPQPVVEDTPTGPEVPPTIGKRQIRFGLFSKIIIVMLIISLLPLLAFWYITNKETEARIRQDSETMMNLTAQRIGAKIDNWFENNVWVLRAASGLPAIRSMNRQQQEVELRKIQERYPFMYLVFTVGLDGMNVARSDDVPPKDYSDRQYYKDIARGKQLSWQTLIGKTSKKPALVLAVPIMNGDQLVGVMAAAMTIDDISKNIAVWKKGKTGYAFLIDEKSKVIAHPNPQFVMKQKNLNAHPLVKSFRKGKWTSHTTKFDDSNGKTYLGHVQQINYGWSLALLQQEKEVYASLNRVQKFFIVLLLSTIAIVTLVSWLSARTIVRPILILTDVAERMSLGDLNMKINVPSKDEIGMLAQAIKRMQTSLRLAMERLRRKR